MDPRGAQRGIELERLSRDGDDEDDDDELSLRSDEDDDFQHVLARRRSSVSSVQSFELYTPDEEKAVLRKLDTRVVLFMSFLYLLSFLDRSSMYTPPRSKTRLNEWERRHWECKDCRHGRRSSSQRRPIRLAADGFLYQLHSVRMDDHAVSLP